MDWTNQAQVWQALFVVLGVGLFFMGYRAGDKL